MEEPMTNAEFVEKLRGWATADREQAEAKRQDLDVPDAAEQVAVMNWFSGFASSDAKREQIQAQASAFKVAAHANGAAADVLEATATAWDAIADQVDEVDAVDDPDQH